MPNLNKVFLMGNLTRDPEIRYTQGGMAVTRLGIAVNRRAKDPATEQWRDQADFIDAVIFGRRAEVVSEYFRKGNPIFIEGRLSYRTWETQTGERRGKLEVIVENFEFIGGRTGQGGGAEASQGSAGSRSSPGPSQAAEPGSTEKTEMGPGSSRPAEGVSAENESAVSEDGTPPYEESGFKDDDVPF